jgi:hypothetical protein
MECPDKVKVFSWRLIHNSLPLKRKIEAKGFELDTRCPVCWRAYEDASHILFRCKFSKLVWRELLDNAEVLVLRDRLGRHLVGLNVRRGTALRVLGLACLTRGLVR